ncbi:Subtilase family protein [Micromonospora nigra]|uniref:Subtilase family protein n=1 Tax=Micromonospora nigra TaxID=145857 RepID=A0A1C6RQ85_9ACTN|nr:S8 family serine peptidase [Micromonospora nigra]SCL19237.1 Subtilase family protein [Micromonospora nigra]
MHRRRKLTAAGLLAGLVLGTPAAVTAAPAGTAPPTSPNGVAGAASPGRPAATTVTLITGDRVTVTATGRASVRPGAGRADVRFLTRRDRGRLEVVPADALPLLRAGTVDRRFFDVTGLVEAGYDDARRADLPVLLRQRAGAERRAAAPGGVTVTRELNAIDGVAATADKKRVGELWTTISGGGARIDTAGGVDRIWLDGRRKVTLEHSVPQIGAPVAHQAGFTGRGVRVAVLDTGVDAAHPDLVGRVAEARNFTEETDPGDIVGHGTHVASIVAGSGAASGGRNRGVAPDATLLSGKVCEQYGCTESAILAGMHWAATEQRADVVNLSLGGWDTPEVDPVEEAVDTLTAQTGALFVISAGNAGSAGSVGSPASADAALAVGAVDRDDELAWFSSQGPRVGDDALKPDITAPGVDIVAARAAGTRLGEPAGEGYVTLSGTSMSAPHVAGAAALLAQRHTGWTAGQLKATLMASAKAHPELTAYQQGAGRVDVARAIDQALVSDPPSVSFGRTLWPHDDDAPVTREVTWRNGGTTDLTLNLTVEASGPGGAPVPAGLFRLSTTALTVPAGGTATATVTADTGTGGPDGHWTGRIVARSGAVAAVTPIAVHQEVESYTVTIRHLDGAGAPTGNHSTTLVDLADFASFDVFDPDGVAEVRLPKGRYGLSSYLYEDGAEPGASLVAQPELVVDGDTGITVDARRARPIRMTVPDRSATPALVEVSANFLIDDGGYSFGLISDDFAGLASGQLGERVPADRFVGSVSSQWADLEADSSPYLYALSEVFPGRLPAGFERHYRRGDLATITQTFRGGYPDLSAERLVFPAPPHDLGGWAVGLPTTVPGRRVEHVNTRGMGWTTELLFGAPTDDGWLDYRVALSSDSRTYRAGQRYRDTWNGAPYGVNFPAPRRPGEGLTRQGDLITLAVPLFSDAVGHAGGSVVDSARTSLYRGGVLVGESPEPGWGQFEVPAGAADYRLESTAKRSVGDLSTEVTTTWTFPSRRARGNEPLRLPASAIRFLPPLDAANSAPAGKLFPVPVQVHRQAGAPAAKVTALRVEVSYDGGTTWRRADVVKVGGQWTALLRHPAGPGHVSLKATARAADGTTVTQRTVQAYRLR